MSHLNTRLVQIQNYLLILEKRVYTKLCVVETMTNARNIMQAEEQIWKILNQLDELQDEMDDIIAKLKDAGEWVNVSYDGNVYRAKPKKYKAPPRRDPDDEWIDRQVFPVESPTPAKLKAKKDAEKKAAQEARAAAREQTKAARKANRDAAREATRKATEEARAAERLAKAEDREAARAATRAAVEAERKAARAVREAARREAIAARKAANPKVVRVAGEPKPKPQPKPKPLPKPKPEPKPRPPRESAEVKRIKKRRDKARTTLANLDQTIERENEALLVRLEERKTRVHEVRNLHPAQNGHQRRADARKNLENVEAQLRGLGQRKQDRYDALIAQIAQAEADLEKQLLIENGSQLMV